MRSVLCTYQGLSTSSQNIERCFDESKQCYITLSSCDQRSPGSYVSISEGGGWGLVCACLARSSSFGLCDVRRECFLIRLSADPSDCRDFYMHTYTHTCVHEMGCFVLQQTFSV